MNSWATPKRSSHLRALRQVSQFFSPYRVVVMPCPGVRDAGHDAEHHRERPIPVVVTVFGVKGFRAVTARASFTPSALLVRSEEHTSELQSLMRISYAVFCLKKKNE